jgi:predicted ArsR family transcriptional regulator
LVAALRKTFQRETYPVETIFRMATAFTHPRRLEIVRALQAGPRTAQQIQVVTRISSWALWRHLRKLEVRGFVISRRGFYSLAHWPQGLGRQFARLAREGPRESKSTLREVCTSDRDLKD